MPRKISASKKYLEALSRTCSPWSHRFGLGNLKFCGGRPAGVAASAEDVEKEDAVAILKGLEVMK